MKYLVLFIIASILVSTQAIAINGDLGGGAGSSSNPYQIEDFQDFQEFCSDSSYWGPGKYTELTVDLDLSAHPYTTAPIAPRGDGTLPVFEGHFDGNSKVITGLTIDGGAFLGLFGRSGVGSTLSHIVLEGGSITSTSSICGAVCGECYADVTGCVSSVSVSGGSNIGGICGTLRSTSIANCRSTGQVTGTDSNVGGIFGAWDNYSGGTPSVSNCHSTGDVIGDLNNSQRVGGICGKNSYVGAIINCSSTGDISGYRGVGGICGENYSAKGNIEGCFSTGDIHSNDDGPTFTGVGGICGVLDNYSDSSNANIVNCYATGDVSSDSSDSYTGGICGYIKGGDIIHCYAAGQVSGNTADIGGACGALFYTVNVTTGCFWNTDVNSSSLTGIGNRTDSGVTGVTTVQMQTQSTFTDAGWDFINEPTNGNDDIWFMPAGDYPRLAWQTMLTYDGTLEMALAPDETSSVTFDLLTLVDLPQSWTITGYDSCQWITTVAPTSGTLTGLSDSDTITVSIDTTGIAYGQYICNLSVNTTGTTSLMVPISLTVYNRVDMEEFAILSQYWQMDGCDGQPCSEADWFTDGSIDILDLQQLAISWLGAEMIYDADGFGDDFESGDFETLDWIVDDCDADWTVVSDVVYEGSYSARSGIVDDWDCSILMLTIDTQEYNTVSFYRKTDGIDYWSFSIYDDDGDYYEDYEWYEGQPLDWGKEEYTFPPGEYTFMWYIEGLADEYLWLDNIYFSTTDTGEIVE